MKDTIVKYPARVSMLAVDPGAKSGWAILNGYESPGSVHLSASGDLRNAQDMAAVIARLYGERSKLKRKIVMVGESWKGAGGPFGGNQRIMTGLGAAWGRWEACAALGGIPASRVMRIDTGTWRQICFGSSRMRSVDAKRAAIVWVDEMFGLECKSDRAEAICLGYAAMHVQRVHAKGERS